MKNQRCVSVLSTLIVIILVSATVAVAQTPADPVVSSLKRMDATFKDYIIRSAEKMPEENYSFKPAPEVKTFGQMLGHIADSQYAFAAAVLGEKTAEPGIEKNKTAKADIIQALKEACAYSDRAFNGLTDAKAGEMVAFFGRQMPKLSVLTMNYGHNTEHYGNLVTYLRIKGLVPPSSEPRK